jgi:hypothetical protein
LDAATADVLAGLTVGMTVIPQVRLFEIIIVRIRIVGS